MACGAVSARRNLVSSANEGLQHSGSCLTEVEGAKQGTRSKERKTKKKAKTIDCPVSSTTTSF